MIEFLMWWSASFVVTMTVLFVWAVFHKPPSKQELLGQITYPGTDSTQRTCADAGVDRCPAGVSQ